MPYVIDTASPLPTTDTSNIRSWQRISSPSLPASILYDQRIIRVIQAIESHHATHFTLDKLADLADISPCHFSRHFHATMKESVFHYIRRTRLEKAAIKLMLSSHTVLQIAMDIGYSSNESFSRAFHRQFGVSPSHFRRRYQPSGLHSDGTDSPLRARLTYIDQPLMMLVAMRTHYHDYADIDVYWKHFAGALQEQDMDFQTAIPVGICLDDDETTPPGRRRYNCAAVITTRGMPLRLRSPLFLQAISPKRCIQLECQGTRTAIQREASQLASLVHAMGINDTLNTRTVMEHYDLLPWTAPAQHHQLRIRMFVT